MEAVFAAGAAGFLLQRGMSSHLLDAVNTVLAGRRYGSPEAAATVIVRKEVESWTN